MKTFLQTAYIFTTCVIFLIVSPKEDNLSTNIKTTPIQKKKLIEKPTTASPFDFVRTIPGDNNNLRSPQLTIDQLTAIAKSGRIKRIIRMNGDGKDSAGVSRSKEKQICERYNIEYLFINAHSRHRPHDRVHQLLLDGNTLIHCRHGYDRTGAMVGYHLRRLGHDVDYVIAHNDWVGYVERKGEAYRRYFNFIL